MRYQGKCQLITKSEFWLPYMFKYSDYTCGEVVNCPKCGVENRAGGRFHSNMRELDKLVIIRRCHHLVSLSGNGIATWK